MDLVPAVYQTLTITAITRDSGTAGGPVAPDWATGIAWVMAEAVGTGTTEAISNKSNDTQFNPEFDLSAEWSLFVRRAPGENSHPGLCN